MIVLRTVKSTFFPHIDCYMLTLLLIKQAATCSQKKKRMFETKKRPNRSNPARDYSHSTIVVVFVCKRGDTVRSLSLYKPSYFCLCQRENNAALTSVVSGVLGRQKDTPEWAIWKYRFLFIEEKTQF